MTTLKDVAIEAQTSITTVSLVLNNKAEQRGISPETQARVRAAAKLLSYRRNPYARALRTGFSNVIGVVGVGLDSLIPHAKTYAAAQILYDLGFNVIAYDFNWQQDTSGLIEFITGLGVAGVLLTAYSPCVLDALNYCTASGIPLVAMDDWQIPGVRAVGVDRAEGAYQAVMHLLELGHRRIAITSSSNPQDVLIRARVRGYIAAYREAGLTIDESMFLGFDDAKVFNHGYELSKTLLNHPNNPTAVFCSNDEIALGVIKGMYENNISIPEQISIVGFNDSSDALKSVVPLTTVHQPIDEVVAAAVNILREMIEKPQENPEASTTVIPTRLIVRQSTAEPSA